MADPDDTAPTAPTLPVDAPNGSDGSEAGVGAPDGSTGLQAAPRPKRSRRAQRSPAPEALVPRGDVASRAGALDLIASDCAGSEAQPPLPLAIACRLRGVPLRTVEDGIARGEHPALEAARAQGIARCLRMATLDPANGRNWWNLAERLAPKELHLPTKVHTGQDPDAAPAASRVEVSLVDAREVARGVVTAALLPGKKDPTP